MSLTDVPIVGASKPTEVIMTRLELSKARAELWVNISRCYQASGKTLNEYFKLCLEKDIKEYDTSGVYSKCPSFRTLTRWVQEQPVLSDNSTIDSEPETNVISDSNSISTELSEKEVVLSNLPSESGEAEHGETKPLSLDCCIKTALVVAISLFHSQNQLLGIPKKEANFSPQYMATMLLHYACTMFREGNIKSLQERIMSDSSLLIGSKTLYTAASMYHKLYPHDNAIREDGDLATPDEDFIFSQGRVYVPLKSFAKKKGARHKLDYLDKAVNFIPPDMAGTIEALFAQEEKPTHRHSHFN